LGDEFGDLNLCFIEQFGFNERFDEGLLGRRKFIKALTLRDFV